jgi:hypothetical protein
MQPTAQAPSPVGICRVRDSGIRKAVVVVPDRINANPSRYLVSDSGPVGERIPRSVFELMLGSALQVFLIGAAMSEITSTLETRYVPAPSSEVAAAAVDRGPSRPRLTADEREIASRVREGLALTPSHGVPTGARYGHSARRLGHPRAGRHTQRLSGSRMSRRERPECRSPRFGPTVALTAEA